MPVIKDREYRNLLTPLTLGSGAKRIESNYYVEGYATTFNKPYVLWEFDDGTKYYEVIDRHALDNADISDVIMQYDHHGRVYARQSNKSLIIQPDESGLFVCADLSLTEGAKELYGDIAAGMITKMSWAFIVQEDSFDRATKTRTILKVKKVYDVSAVSMPANDDTEISARSYAQGSSDACLKENLELRARLLKLKTMI